MYDEEEEDDINIYELYESGEYEEALKQCDELLEAIDISEENFNKDVVFELKAMCLMGLDRYAEAILVFKSLTTKKATFNLLIQVAECYIFLKKYKQAEAYLKKALIAKPDSFEVWFGLARSQFFLSDYDQAYKSIDRAIELDELPPMMLNIKIMFLFSQRRDEEADELAKFTKQKYPNDQQTTKTLFGVFAADNKGLIKKK